MSGESEKRLGKWQNKWDSNNIGFHQPQVHKMLHKHSASLFQKETDLKFFIPLCGKTLDMKWLLDQGHNVVGLDGVKKALEDFCNEHGSQWVEEKAPALGDNGGVMKVKDEKMKLYNGDIFLFNQSLEGQFDCIWDRGSLVALNREDVKSYVALIMDILKPGGKILLEVFEYDTTLFDSTKRPPPHPMKESEIRSLYEPSCVVDLLERDSKMMDERQIGMAYYLIVKK